MRVEELPYSEADRADVDGLVRDARRHVDAAIDSLARLNVATRAELWPHRSSDGCEPERDLRDAQAHLDQVLVRHTAREAVAPEVTTCEPGCVLSPHSTRVACDFGDGA